jgi:hypothetical protein
MFLAFIDQLLPTLLIFIGIIVAIVIVYFVFFAPRNRAGKKEIGVTKLEEDENEVIEDPVEIKPYKAPEPVLNNEETLVQEKVREVKLEENAEEEKEEISEEVKTEIVKEVIKPEDVLVDDIEIPEELSPEEEKMLIPEDSLETLEEEMEDKKEQERLLKEENKEEPKELGKYHVLYRKDDNKWYVKREGSDKTLRVLETQAEAIAWATIKALNQDTTIVIHKRDGKIRKQNY